MAPRSFQAAGLSAAQVSQRLAADGPNALPRPPRRTAWRIVLEVLREPLFQLLVAAQMIYLVLGDVSEAAGLLVFLLVIVGVTVVQERRTERVLEALHDLTSPGAWVWRDGSRQHVAGTALVQGDVLELTEGERIPADARLFVAHDVAVDESLLSGESLPVAKTVAEGAAGQVFAGTLVVAGQALAEVTATGVRSQMGRIGKVLGTLQLDATPLQQQTRQLVRWFSVLGLVVSVSVAALYIGTRGDWLGGTLAGITMAMSMLPQEFLLILTVFMAMGAWRLSRHRVLTRRASTIETLGAATVLCTDKTGTLTHNRMAVQALVACAPHGLEPWQAGAALPQGPLHTLLQHSVLASEIEPFDPMERALHALAAQHGYSVSAEWQLVHEYSLAADLPVMSHAWRVPGATAYTVAAKGAPEQVVQLCRLPLMQAEPLLAQAHALADQGMRVLAVAVADWCGPDWPDTQSAFAFRLLGLLAFADPLRTNVPQAVADCQRAGIRVVMITGDHPGTALAIARQAGIDTAGGVLRGEDIRQMDDTALQQCVARAAVFARVAPQQKLRIVQALQAAGEVVAMTGDGVNDAPSLKAAHIGIAMGQRGTDVAREAASLVLLDDDFGTLVQAVRIGRRIYDNLRKAMRFVFAVHVPIAGLTLVPMVLGWPLLFTPLHIAFLEIVIDPVCSVVFESEAEEADVMDRPPRDPTAPLFTPVMIAHSLLQGGLVLVVVGLFYGGLLHQGVAEAAARVGAFMALVASNMVLIVVNRSVAPQWGAVLRVRNRSVWVMAAITAALLALVIAIAPLRAAFGFVVPDMGLVAMALGSAMVVLLVLLGHRRLFLKHAVGG